MLTISTGIWLVSASRDSARVAWKPFMPGSTTSINTRSGLSRLQLAMPSSALPEVVTLWPLRSSNWAMTAASVGESSISSMRAMRALPPGQALTYVRIALSSSSRVKGLVRYCSEPTIRPRALSNKPSFDESMMTGTDLKVWLFLISAQV